LLRVRGDEGRGRVGREGERKEGREEGREREREREREGKRERAFSGSGSRKMPAGSLSPALNLVFTAQFPVQWSWAVVMAGKG
jgi:hypothetical protein